jgi:hypothetical protein
MPIFCDANWPRKITKIFTLSRSAVKNIDQDKKCTSSLQPEDNDGHGMFQTKIICIESSANLDEHYSLFSV